MIKLAELIDKTYEIYTECAIRTCPIECVKILEHYGFKIKTYSQIKEKNAELHMLCTRYSNDAFSDIDNRFIAYNDRAHYARIRFSLMHEFGHFILGHDPDDDNPENEDEADMFASHILAPRPVLLDKEYNTADKIHDAFGISYAASNRCLDDTRKLMKTHSSILWDKRIRKQFTPEPQTNNNSYYFQITVSLA